MAKMDGWTGFTWAALAFNILFATLFALLCWFSWGEFRRVAHDPNIMKAATVEDEDWISLFNGAAASAFFAVVLVCIFTAVSIYYMMLSRKSLAHPRSKFGRGFLIATTLFCALHVCNIAVHFYSFRAAMSTWVTSYRVAFNNALLASTYIMGFFSTLSFLVLTAMLAFWHDTTAEHAEREILASARV